MQIVFPLTKLASAEATVDEVQKWISTDNRHSNPPFHTFGGEKAFALTGNFMSLY